MLIAELAALGAAFCWALSGLIIINPLRKIGALALNRVRMSLVFLMLAAVSVMTGAWRDFPVSTLQTLMISGLIGIFLGDTALFGSLKRLGTSRAAVVFALHAPMTVIMGWFLLSERLEVFTLIGCGIVTTGVIIAILGRKNHEEPQNIDSTHGRMRYGILLGLLGAFGQAAGAIIARPVMAEGVDPVTASAIRVGIAALCLIFTGFIPNPLLWMTTGIRPPLMAWISAVVTVFGIALITIAWN